MYIIGRGSKARETYPGRGGGPTSLTAQPFAQLKLSQDQAYSAGVAAPILFDTIVYQSAPFGGFEVFGGNNLFFVPFGVYLCVLQVEVDGEDISRVASSIGVQSGSALSGGSSTSDYTNASPADNTTSMSAVRLASELPIPGTLLPCAVVPILNVESSSPGVVVSDVTRLLVWKLAQFSP